MSEAGSTHALIERNGSERLAPKRLPQLSVSGILSPISVAIDLAEGRAPGHARRVAYIAMSLAAALGLEREEQIAACHAGLMHDIGVIAAGARVAGATRGDERLVFSTLPLLTPEEAVAGFGDASPAVIDGVAQHVSFGASAARDLGLSEDVVQAISTHHERWDGEG
ncbi:MAG TPA: HDIG domain-containing protein, partial [Dehalococcoidia bacterium]|nr:HDIG domain-containing protein [Dehalococcoidia bacterium]